MKRRHRSNEWEFQAQVVSWFNEVIARQPGLGLEKATAEPPKGKGRSDLLIWFNRNAGSALLEIELKTPETSLSDPNFLLDASHKAQLWGAPYFALWNMQAAELYRTPPSPVKATPADKTAEWEPDTLISDVDDWLKEKSAVALHSLALEILDRAWQAHSDAALCRLTIDASIFVDKLAERLLSLQAEILPALKLKTRTDRSLRRKVRNIAAAQGFIGLVDDLELAITGQFAYRLIGQILFYFALRRKQPSLKPLELSDKDILPNALRPYWDDVRRFDYEALFETGGLDDLVPLPLHAQRLIRSLIKEFSEYDWNSLRDDVLGSVFENLIPTEQQMHFGQFYTPSAVADVLVAFTTINPDSLILDPGCGSGTFLMRAYEYLHKNTEMSHEDILTRLWGFDLSSLAAELAAINLYRQNLAAFDNFPRIVCKNFFSLHPEDEIPFPPARSGGQDKVVIPIPVFDAIIGNPPYLRSQNQDDLDPTYKSKLFKASRLAGVKAATKTDLFGFFIYKALEFMRPGSRIGFVTSASWLTADYGLSLQRLLFDKLRLVALIGSAAESFFTQVDVNAVLLVAERRDGSIITDDEVLKFVLLKRPLSQLFPPSTDYWSELIKFYDSIDESLTSSENENFRVIIVKSMTEYQALQVRPKVARNWSTYLRAPLTYFKLFGGAE